VQNCVQHFNSLLKRKKEKETIRKRIATKLKKPSEPSKRILRAFENEFAPFSITKIDMQTRTETTSAE